MPFAICEFDPEPINPCQQQCWDDLSHWLIGRRATRWHAVFAGAASGASSSGRLLRWCTSRLRRGRFDCHSERRLIIAGPTCSALRIWAGLQLHPWDLCSLHRQQLGPVPPHRCRRAALSSRGGGVPWGGCGKVTTRALSGLAHSSPSSMR